MSEITLSGVYLAPVSDLSDLLILNAGVAVEQSGGIRGEVRSYAGGVTRLIKRAGKSRSWAVTFPRISRTTKEILEAWEGETLLIRDGHGLLAFGCYLQPAIPSLPGLPLFDCAFVFLEITTTIEV